MLQESIPDEKPEGLMRVFLETFGCQMNILDSELVESQLKLAGHQFVQNADDANVVLLNTCSVRALSEQKVLSRLGILKERKRKGEKLVVGVMGCMAERAHAELKKKHSSIDVLVGPSKIHDVKNLLESAFSQNGNAKKISESLSLFVNRKGVEKNSSLSPQDSLEALDQSRLPNSRKNSWQAYVRITRGCNKFCSFCVVPKTRGPEMHRPPESIIDEIKKLVDSGVLEVTLLGQTINHYAYDGAKRWSFADLLFQVHEQVPHLKRLRFLTSYPRDFGDDALDVMKSCDRICKYLHIPAQSGSDKVLLNMNRGYDVATYMSLIERAKSRMPNISLLGDMIVGFPNESDEDFAMSLDLLRTVRYKGLYIFKYSPRPDTVAQSRFADNIPMAVKKERNNIMLGLQNDLAFELHKEMINKTFTVLCEGEAKLNPQENKPGLVQLGARQNKEHARLTGRTEGDHIVHFNGPTSLIGKLATVTIRRARALSLDADLF